MTRHTHHMDRRNAVKALAGAGLALAGAACTPMRAVLHLYPEDFDRRTVRTDLVLRAFVGAVVPGVELDDPNLTRAFYDDFYPFAKYRGFLIAELCRGAEAMTGSPAFEQLTLADRTGVIDHLSKKGGPTGQIVRGAIFLSQVSCYGGIYDDDRGCPLIGFEGRVKAPNPRGASYPNGAQYLATALTGDGNPA